MRPSARIAVALVVCASACPHAAADPPRFTGDGEFRVAAAQSLDGRFTMEGELRLSTDISREGRFELDARLHAPRLGKAATAAICDGLFANGFEG